MSTNDIANIIAPSHSTIYPGTGTIPDLIVVSGANLFIRGIFHMKTRSIAFYNCILNMDVGCVIITPDGLEEAFILERTIVQGTCDNMWEGIRIGGEGELHVIDNSYIHDAEYAIRIHFKMYTYLENSFFSRNYVTIYGEPTTSINHFPGNIENCNFDGGQLLVPGRYIGQNNYGQIGSLGHDPIPQDDRPFAAMEFHGLDNGGSPVAIPFNTSVSTPNVIHDFNVGIYGYNSQIDVFNCRFENITGVPGYNFYGDFGGSAIYAEADLPTPFHPLTTFKQLSIGAPNSSGFYTENSFENIRRSVYIKGDVNGNVTSNTIDNNSYVAIEVKGSVGRNHIITDNIINQTRNGIFGNLNEQSSLLIEGNTITTINDNQSGRWGICISDNSVACTASVLNNFVTSYSDIGIYGRFNKGSTYQGNVVILDHLTIDPNLMHLYGIRLDYCNSNVIDCNYSGGPAFPAGSFYSRYHRGFSINFSTDNIIKCNTATECLFGFQFLSGCNGTQFYGNSLGKSYDGLLLGDYWIGTSTDMGSQGIVNSTNNSPGNLFFGVNNAGNFGHGATMTINSSPPLGSLWVNTGIYYPIGNYNSGGSPIIPFIANGYVPYQCSNCGGGGGGGSASAMINAESIALDTISPNSVDEEVIKWDLEKKLFETLLIDSIMLDSSTVLQNFMDTTQFSNIGKFGEVTIELKTISDERLSGSSDSLIEILINLSKNKNSGIATNSNHEAAQKLINEIVLNTTAKGIFIFSSAQTTSIMAVANLCPYTHGPAVFLARSLANFIDGTLYFDDNILCNNAQVLRKRNPEFLKENISVQMYPNPASIILNVNITLSLDASGELQFYNLLGSKVYSKSIKSQSDLSNIDIHSLDNGIYTCRLELSSSTIILGKLSIMH